MFHSRGARLNQVASVRGILNRFTDPLVAYLAHTDLHCTERTLFYFVYGTYPDIPCSVYHIQPVSPYDHGML